MTEESWSMEVGFLSIEHGKAFTDSHNLKELYQKLQNVSGIVGYFEPCYLSSEDIGDMLRINTNPSYKSDYKFVTKKKLVYGNFKEIFDFDFEFNLNNLNFPPKLIVKVDELTSIISWDDSKTMKIGKNIGGLIIVSARLNIEHPIFLVGEEKIAEVIENEFLGKYKLEPYKFFEDLTIENELERLNS